MIYDLVNYNAGSEFKCEPSFQISEMKLGHRDQAVDGSQSARRELLPAGTIAKMTLVVEGPRAQSAFVSTTEPPPLSFQVPIIQAIRRI